jgi:hypothetical protein
MLIHCIVLEGNLKFTSEDVLKTKLKEMVPSADDRQIYFQLEHWNWRWDEHSSRMRIRSTCGYEKPELYGPFYGLDDRLPELEQALQAAALVVQEDLKFFVFRNIQALTEKDLRASYLLVGRSILDYLPRMFLGVPVRENKL